MASMKIVRAYVGLNDVEWNNLLCLDVNHALLMLELPVNAQDAAARYDQAVGLKDTRCDDDVGDAGLVF